jgi:hypothetical protein
MSEEPERDRVFVVKLRPLPSCADPIKPIEAYSEISAASLPTEMHRRARNGGNS